MKMNQTWSANRGREQKRSVRCYRKPILQPSVKRRQCNARATVTINWLAGLLAEEGATPNTLIQTHNCFQLVRVIRGGTQDHASLPVRNGKKKKKGALKPVEHVTHGGAGALRQRQLLRSHSIMQIWPLTSQSILIRPTRRGRTRFEKEGMRSIWKNNTTKFTESRQQIWTPELKWCPSAICQDLVCPVWHHRDW